MRCFGAPYGWPREQTLRVALGDGGAPCTAWGNVSRSTRRQPRWAFCVFVACLTLASAVCQAQTANTVNPLQSSAIDVDRVARDLDTVAKNKGTTTVWTFDERAKATLDAPPVPMFMPPEIVADLSNGSQKSDGKLEDTGGEGESRILNFPDEYFAIRQFDKFSMTVHGTRKKFAASGDPAGDKAVSAPSDDYYKNFTTTEGGGLVGFGYAGADYLVEFECDEGPGCIDATEAERIVRELVMCGADGRCVDNGTELIAR